MHFTLTAQVFRELITGLKAVVSSKTSLPILRCALFTVSPDGRSLTARATDLDIELTVTLPLTIPGSPGTAAIALKIPAALRPDKGSSLSIEATAAAATARVTTAGVFATLNLEVLDPSDFPPSPDPPDPDSPSALLPATTLQAIATSLSFQSADETRYVLNGTFLDPEDGGSVVATDGRRLIVVHTRVSPVPLIIPTKTCQILARFHAAHPDSKGCRAELYVDPDNRRASAATFHLSATTALHSKLIDGNFPNWRQVIPDQPQPSLITFGDPAGLAKFLRSLPPPPRGEVSVLLQPLAGQSRVAVSHARGSATFAALLENDPPPIRFNPAFLAAALDELPGSLQLTSSDEPAILTATNGKAILMPMRLS